MPNKQNIKRYGWRKQYVVVSRKKILFYNSENHKQNADPVMVLDIEYVFESFVGYTFEFIVFGNKNIRSV